MKKNQMMANQVKVSKLKSGQLKKEIMKNMKNLMRSKNRFGIGKKLKIGKRE